MKINTTYLKSAFLLLLPIIIWNISFYTKLPKAYSNPEIWDAVPDWIRISENVMRFLVFGLPLLFSLSFKGLHKTSIIIIYVLGVLLYFSSWYMQINFPNSSWSLSMIGFTAPSFTSLFWLLAISAFAKNNFIKVRYLSKIYLSFLLLFSFVHTWHAILVFSNRI